VGADTFFVKRILHGQPVPVFGRGASGAHRHVRNPPAKILLADIRGEFGERYGRFREEGKVEKEETENRKQKTENKRKSADGFPGDVEKEKEKRNLKNRKGNSIEGRAQKKECGNTVERVVIGQCGVEIEEVE